MTYRPGLNMKLLQTKLQVAISSGGGAVTVGSFEKSDEGRYRMGLALVKKN